MDWKEIQQLFAAAKTSAGENWIEDEVSDEEEDESVWEEEISEAQQEKVSEKKTRPDSTDNALQATSTASASAATASAQQTAKSQSKTVSTTEFEPVSGEAFYDENLDTEDAQWVKQNLRPYLKDRKDLPKSDATLSCPLCFTTVCYDCQQHVNYKNQFRAVFTVNTIDDTSQVLEVEGESYIPVRCARCKVQVAVKDKDEIYHFFNVLAGEAPE